MRSIERAPRLRVAGEGALRQQVVGERRARGVAPGLRDREAGEGGAGAAGGVDERRHRVPEHQVARPEAGLELRGDVEERLRLARLGVLGRVDPPDHEHQPAALHADQHVGVEVPGGAAQHVDVEHLGRRADQHADLAVPVPAERRDAARQLAVVLAGQDAVDDERFEACVPQTAGLGGAGVDVGGGEGDLARVQQDRLAQRLVVVFDALLDDLDRHADQLQRLLQAHRAQQLARGGAEHVGGDPRDRLGVVEPRDERGDAVLRHQPDGAAPARRHVAVPRQRVVEPFQRRRRQLTRERAQPGERLRLRAGSHAGVAAV